ncbi:MAG: hypothetical protein ACLTBV_33810 [Enterocloster bolteae]
MDIYLKSGRQALSMVKELMEDFDRVWTNARPQKEKLPTGTVRRRKRWP